MENTLIKNILNTNRNFFSNEQYKEKKYSYFDLMYDDYLKLFNENSNEGA